jgi:hypothetical protein
MIKNNENETNLSKKIHFIFVIMRNGDGLNLEGENVEDFFKILNDCKCPVYFIINNTEKDYENEIIDSLREGLNINCDNILKEENFINANFKIDDVEEIHGINKIFEKIYDYIINKNILNGEIKEKMEKLIKDFRKIEKNEVFFDELNEEEENKIILEEKSKLNYKAKIEELNKLWESNEFFSKISTESILENGRLFAKSCKDVIITLSNLKGILPSISRDIPLISILQAFMVKEIEMGYGLNINSLNYGLKILKNNFEAILLNNKNNELENNNINDNNNNKKEVLNESKLSENIDSIAKKVYDLLDKSNKKLLFQLARLLMKLTEVAKYNQLEDSKIFNVEFTNVIEKFCSNFFEKEIIFSERLTFMYNYYQKLSSLVEDLKYYSSKEEWDSYEMEIKK